MSERSRGKTQRAEETRREIDRAIGELTPEQAEQFERLLARAAKRRWILLTGYALSFLALLGGLALAFYVYGTWDSDSFRAWVFLVPIGAMGLIFTVTGRIARRFEI